MTGKFASPLAEELFDHTLSSFQDDELGESDSFGWFALFRQESAILHCDSRGFVGVAVADDIETAWQELSNRWTWFQFDHLNESCEDLFLILDTARHGGWTPDFEEVGQHVSRCLCCQELGNDLSE